MGKISDYTRVLAAKLADVFVVDQTDNGTTATKSATVEQIGTAIGTLQNFADLDTSNKNLVDAINEIASYTPVYGNTASGSIATFDTSLALPLQDCTIEINAVQESGTPTPSSPKLISGFTGANIHVADDETPHVIDNVTAITWQSEAGTVYGGYSRIVNGIVKLVANWGGKLLNGTENYVGFSNNGTTLVVDDMKSGLNQQFKSTYMPLSTAYTTFGLRFGFNNNTVYFYQITDLPGVTDVATFKTYLSNNPLLIVYELSTPVEYTLASVVQPSSIVGTNNVFTDTNGDTSVVYACSLKDYIDRQ